MTHRILTPFCVLLAGVTLSACAVKPTESTTAASAAQQQALADLEQDYNAGQYANVAQTVGLSVTLQTAPPSVHRPAMKLQAFSYCLQSNTYQCKRSFDKLLQRYPDFDLAPSERDHPMWGPVFAEAKAGANSANATARANIGTDSDSSSLSSR
jgi:hypothetical protein